MKWQAAPLYLRRSTARIDAAAVLGPIIDLLVYLAAVGVGTSTGRSQILGFVAAAAFCYWPHLRAAAGANGRPRGFAFYVHVLIVTLLAFLLRSGVFALLSNGWGWPGQAAIVFAVLATLAVVRPGYAYCISSPKWILGSGVGWRAGAVGIVAFAWVLRLMYSGQVELLPEETYYWNYSRHLDFGYLDHPPMVGWLISAGTAVFGNTEFGVRIGALACGAIASWFMYRLTRNLFGEPAGLGALALMQALPFFFLAGLLMTPDAPLTAAWAGTLYFLERALLSGRRGAWWWAGVWLGLGLLSKYTIGLLAISAFIFMLLDARSRLWFRRFEPYGAALLACAIFSPVLVWNAQNQWISFAFQTSRRLAEHPRFQFHKLLGSWILLLTPTGMAATAVLLLGDAPTSAGRDESDEKRRAWRFIQVTALVPLAVFVLFSLRHEVKVDWTGAPLLAALPLLAFGLTHSGPKVITRVRAWIRATWVPTIVILLLFYGFGLYFLAFGIQGLGYSKHSEWMPVGWREFGTEINRIADGIDKTDGADPLIIGMDRYAIASELAFYSPDHVKAVSEISSAHLFGQVGLMYERWFPLAQEKGRTLLLVAWKREDLSGDEVQASVDSLEPIKEGVLTRGNGVIRRYYYRIARGYRGLPAPG
jgi:dolichol-phosphate mannosyltransferase